MCVSNQIKLNEYQYKEKIESPEEAYTSYREGGIKVITKMEETKKQGEVQKRIRDAFVSFPLTFFISKVLIYFMFKKKKH